MKNEDLMKLLGDLDDDLILEAAPKRTERRRSPLVLIAAALILVFTFTLGAFAATTVIQYTTPSVVETTHTETDTGLYVPVENVIYGDESGLVSVEMIRMTGDHSVAYIYFEVTLSEKLANECGESGFRIGCRDVELYVDADYRQKMEIPLTVDAKYIGLTEKSNTYEFCLRLRGDNYSSELPLDQMIANRYLKIRFANLYKQRETLVDGTWHVRFYLNYPIISLQYESFSVEEGAMVNAVPDQWKVYPSSQTDIYTVTSVSKVMITSNSVYIAYECISENPSKYPEEKYFYRHHIAPWYMTLVLKDGTTIEQVRGFGGGYATTTYPCISEASYALSAPIDPDSVAAILWGGLRIDLADKSVVIAP